MIFIFQGGFLGVLGALLGALLGAMLVKSFTTFVSVFSIEIRPAQMILVIIVTTIAGIVSSLIPANTSAKMNPIEVIRNA